MIIWSALVSESANSPPGAYTEKDQFALVPPFARFHSPLRQMQVTPPTSSDIVSAQGRSSDTGLPVFFM